MMIWQTSRRKLVVERPLVMAILNVTPDSFSDGGRYLSVDDALKRAGNMIAAGADIIDIGGESTRPGSRAVTVDEEIGRTAPVVEAIAKRFDTPVSIDTTKSAVARAAVELGAEIVNDISALRFDEGLADVAGASGTGLVLMHSRGSFETMHAQPAAGDIFADVRAVFHTAIAAARVHGVRDEQIVLDVGIGFGKTQEQNLELLAKLDKIVDEFHDFPMLVGASRKSFIDKIDVNASAPQDRLGGSIAAALAAIGNGASIIRVHEVDATVQAISVARAIRQRNE